jgi:hypothetical protein
MHINYLTGKIKQFLNRKIIIERNLLGQTFSSRIPAIGKSKRLDPIHVLNYIHSSIKTFFRA